MTNFVIGFIFGFVCGTVLMIYTIIERSKVFGKKRTQDIKSLYGIK